MSIRIVWIRVVTRNSRWTLGRSLICWIVRIRIVTGYYGRNRRRRSGSLGLEGSSGSSKFEPSTGVGAGVELGAGAIRVSVGIEGYSQYGNSYSNPSNPLFRGPFLGTAGEPCSVWYTAVQMAKQPLSIRIDEKVKKAALKLSKAQNRSLTNLIETLIREACQQHGIKI